MPLPIRQDLTPAEQMALIRRIALYEPTDEIIAWFKDIGKTCSEASLRHEISVYRNSDKWRPVIERLREAFESKVADIPMASKRNRVQRLNDMHEKLYGLQRYDAAAKQLKYIHDEIEGETNGRPNIFITQFNQLTDEEIEEKRLMIINDLAKIKKIKELQNGGKKPIEIEAVPQPDESDFPLAAESGELRDGTGGDNPAV